MIAPAVGGGFGTKAPFYAEEAVIPAAAMKLGRPVKWQEDRREHFLSATQERDQVWQIAIAVDDDGQILGLRGKMWHDTGAFVPWGIIAPYIAATTFPGPYVVPAYKIDLSVVFTNRVATTVVRGAGRPQAVFAMERLMDRVARELKLDRADVRARNMIQPEQMPYSVGLVFRDGKPLVYASGDFPKSQTPRDRALRLRRLSRAPGEGARRGPLPRHRHRQLCRRHRARPVRGRHHSRHAERQGRGRDRRHGAGARHPHHALADRRRQRRLPPRGHRDDRRATPPRSRRASAPSRAARRSMPATPR